MFYVLQVSTVLGTVIVSYLTFFLSALTFDTFTFICVLYASTFCSEGAGFVSLYPYFSFTIMHAFYCIRLLTADVRVSAWFNFLFFLFFSSPMLLVRGRTGEPGEGIVDVGVHHSIWPLCGGMTSQSAPTSPVGLSERLS